MRCLLVLLLTLIPLAHADETFSTSPLDAKVAANAYARATGLSPIEAAGGFELRVWTQDYMTGAVAGTVIFHDTQKSFESSSSYNDGNITIKAARLSKPRPVTKLAELKELVAKLEPYDKAFISCGVMDGGSVLIDAAINGHTITFEVANPQFCKDKASQTIVNILDILAHP